MPEKSICFEVVLPNEDKAVSRRETIAKPEVIAYGESLLMSYFFNNGWWTHRENPDEFEIAGVRLVLRRKKPL